MTRVGSNLLLRRPEVPADEPPPTKPEPTPATFSDNEFGEISIDIEQFIAPGTQKIWTTIPRDMHRAILRQGKPTDFLNDALVYLGSLQEVLAATGRLEALRQAGGKPVSITGNVSDEYANKVDRAVEVLKPKLFKASKSFVVGGCVMLLAEKRGLIPGGDR